MDPIIEAEANRLLELALQRPPTGRADWLRAQAAPAAAIEWVQRRLRMIEATAVNPETAPDFAPAPFAELPAPGARIGPWELIRPLDAGGMGVVYLARRADHSYDMQVAIKFVRVDPLLPASQRAELVARFEKSAACWPVWTIRTLRAYSTAVVPRAACRGWRWSSSMATP